MQLAICFADGPLAGADGKAIFREFVIGETARYHFGGKVHRYKIRDTPEARYVALNHSPLPEGVMITLDWSPFGDVG